MPTFTTNFAPPSIPSGLVLDADIDASVVRLSWDPSNVAAVDFAGFRVYRSADGGVTFTLLQVLGGVDEVAYADYLAPLNANLVYRLTQSNIDFESDPAEGTIELPSARWQVVRAGDASLTFDIPKLRAASLTSPKTADEFRPIGRRGALVVGDVVHAEDGEIRFIVMPDNLAMVALLKAVQAQM